MEYKILIVEDDKEIGLLLKEYLNKYGYNAKCIENFKDILEEYNDFLPHVILMDINLPMYDGFYWCRKIRAVTKNPIIFISARDSSMDQVMAIENGGDDYITKPFSYDIVIAKIKSQIRRAFGEYAINKEQNIIDLYGLKFMKNTLELSYGDKKVILTKREGILIEILMKNYPSIVPRDTLLEGIWDDSEFVEENTLNVNVSRLRKRLNDMGILNAIEAVRGIGYRLNTTWK